MDENVNIEETQNSSKPVIESENTTNQEDVVIERGDADLSTPVDGIDNQEEREGLVKSEEGEKTLAEYIRDEFAKDDGGESIGSLNIQKFFNNIDNEISEEEKKSPTYQKLQRVKEKFLRVVNFNFVHKYRLENFFIPPKYKTTKEKEEFIKQYPELAFKKLEKNKRHTFVSPHTAYKHFKNAFTKEEEKAAKNFFYVFCHYIVHRDANVNAYAIMYVLNRMLRFDENYAKEEFAFRNDLKATTSEELNCHAIKQLILENYSGRITKWKKGKISPLS